MGSGMQNSGGMGSMYNTDGMGSSMSNMRGMGSAMHNTSGMGTGMPNMRNNIGRNVGEMGLEIDNVEMRGRYNQENLAMNRNMNTAGFRVGEMSRFSTGFERSARGDEDLFAKEHVRSQRGVKREHDQVGMDETFHLSMQKLKNLSRMGQGRDNMPDIGGSMRDLSTGRGNIM